MRKTRIERWRTAVAFIAALGAWSAAVPAQALKAQHLPREVVVEGEPLQLNGIAVQRKLTFDVYQVALYLEEPTSQATEALGSDQTKQIRLRLMRNASSDQLASALRDGVLKGGSYSPAVRQRLEQLLEQIPDLRKGEELIITYVPGEGTTVKRAGGTEITLPGKDFADALFAVWLGRDPGVSRIQRELLGG